MVSIPYITMCVRVCVCGGVISVPSQPSHYSRSYLARSRGSIIFLFWKLLNLSRRMLPSGCGTEGRKTLAGPGKKKPGPRHHWDPEGAQCCTGVNVCYFV